MNSHVLRNLCAGLVLSFAAAAQAGIYSGLYIFGDSLSDSGNNSAVGAGPFPQVITDNSYIPSFTYLPAGTYSNGPVWATSFASMMGLSAAPSLAGGTNFAFGGARTGPAGSGFPFSLTDQLGGYLFGAGGVAASDGLYVIAGGGNDARDVLNGAVDLSTAVGNFADNIGAMVDSLQAAGAKHIVVWNAPNLGLAPAVSSVGAGGIGASVAGAMNAGLSARLAGEEGVQIFDLFGLLGEISADPILYGLTNTTDACGAAVNACDPATSLFWDGIHPTAYGHTLLARAMYEAVPEPGVIWLVLSAFGILLVARRRQT